MCESRSDFFKNWTKSFNFIWDHIGNRKLFISPCSPPCPIKIFGTQLYFCKLHIISKCHVWARGGRLSKSPKTDKWAHLYYLQCTKAMEIYCICMFYLNEQTICPILTGILIKNTLIMHINILCKICFSMFNGLCFI